MSTHDDMRAWATEATTLTPASRALLLQLIERADSDGDVETTFPELALELGITLAAVRGRVHTLLRREFLARYSLAGAGGRWILSVRCPLLNAELGRQMDEIARRERVRVAFERLPAIMSDARERTERVRRGEITIEQAFNND